MTLRSRVPSDLNDERAMRAMYDAMDKRQMALGEVADLDSSATLADAIAKINEMLATQRTR